MTLFNGLNFCCCKWLRSNQCTQSIRWIYHFINAWEKSYFTVERKSCHFYDFTPSFTASLFFSLWYSDMECKWIYEKMPWGKTIYVSEDKIFFFFSSFINLLSRLFTSTHIPDILASFSLESINGKWKFLVVSMLHQHPGDWNFSQHPTKLFQLHFEALFFWMQ